ncbi:invertase 2 [Physcia stellaris]|nr:invertase 2 [Physcia stellaris]
MNGENGTRTSKPVPLALRTASPIASPPPTLSPRFSPRSPGRSNFSSSQYSQYGARNPIRGSPLSFVDPNSSESAFPLRRTERSTSFEAGDDAHLGATNSTEPTDDDDQDYKNGKGRQLPATHSIPYRQRHTTEGRNFIQEPQSAVLSWENPRIQTPDENWTASRDTHARNVSGGSLGSISEDGDTSQPLQYFHQQGEQTNGVKLVGSRPPRPPFRSSASDPPRTSSPGNNSNRPHSSHLLPPSNQSRPGSHLARPNSTYSSTDELRRSVSPSRTQSPQYSNGSNPRGVSPESRPVSYIDLLNVPYPQPPPVPTNLDNAHLQKAVGNNASLLSTKKTLDMYRANVKKTNDPSIQYEFAIFMINAAQESVAPSPSSSTEDIGSYSDLLREARHILQRLSDRSYPFAQYYLADGYASGLFNKGVEDNDRAFPLFIAASKHGHAEAGYRAALCYEFGWGTRKDMQKAVQFYRQSASKNHPGAMSRLGRACLEGTMGLHGHYREGLKWLKRAAESADFQYNSAPYELGLLHETGYGDDIFRDESYAAQLFTQSADLGHVEANFRLGDAYEHGKLSCPRDPALSVHFYTGAASKGHPEGMMALCAWYMVGAEPVLARDEAEAWEWAKRAAEAGLPKAQYALGYFTEMGIGCRRDPLEANVWYVRAADQGDDRARIRLAAIRAAASGEARNGKVRGGGGAVLRDGEGRDDGGAIGGGDGNGGEGGKDEREREKKGRKWGIF